MTFENLQGRLSLLAVSGWEEGKIEVRHEFLRPIPPKSLNEAQTFTMSASQEVKTRPGSSIINIPSWNGQNQNSVKVSNCGCIFSEWTNLFSAYKRPPTATPDTYIRFWTKSLICLRFQIWQRWFIRDQDYITNISEVKHENFNSESV